MLPQLHVTGDWLANMRLLADPPVSLGGGPAFAVGLSLGEAAAAINPAADWGAAGAWGVLDIINDVDAAEDDDEEVGEAVIETTIISCMLSLTLDKRSIYWLFSSVSR